MLSLCAYNLGVEIPNWCLWLFPTLWTPPREEELPTTETSTFPSIHPGGKILLQIKFKTLALLRGALLQAGINFYEFSSVRNPCHTDHTHKRTDEATQSGWRIEHKFPIEFGSVSITIGKMWTGRNKRLMKTHLFFVGVCHFFGDCQENLHKNCVLDFGTSYAASLRMNGIKMAMLAGE